MKRDKVLEQEERQREGRKRSKARTREEKLELKRRRARARRKALALEAELTMVYKPVEEWDNEELARGRPRAIDGSFKGANPKWVSAELVETAVKRFKDLSQAEIRSMSSDALKLAQRLVNSTDTDRRGRPLVPVSVQWDVAKWLLEMIHGKPTQRQEIDMSVKLQGILSAAMVQPEHETGELMPAVMDVQSWEQDDDEDSDEDQLAG